MSAPGRAREDKLRAPQQEKSDRAKREEKVLAFWREQHIFEKSLQKPAPQGEYVFYDGPPFANGLPHYGHILASTIKDTIPRYRTMRGYRVARRWGWDCHGLPVENLVEKELGFKSKRDIEEYGVAEFNKAARRSIMKDVADWKRIVPRLGRWADMEHDYRTMDAPYTESVWWAFKNLYDRKLIYEGFKAMHLCPRCGTTLSNFEVAQGYQDIEDYAVTVKLPLLDEPDTSLLVWTTTPWTLPGNAAVAVKGDAPYVKVRVGEGYVITARALKPTGEVVEEFLGKTLVGKRYEPPFDYFKDQVHKHKTHAWRVYAAPFVSLEEGTGIVHIAPAFGEDDLALAQKEKIPLIHHVTAEGTFVATVEDFKGLSVKPKGAPTKTDALVVEWLKNHNLLFAEDLVSHAYPHCWRCDTPLLNWAANSWFVKVSDIKKKLLSENAKVHWVPVHVGKGRFRNGLASAPDWAISRSRFWGAPIPVWRHTKTKEVRVVGSVGELLGLVRRSGNHYFVMRHGQAQSNAMNVLDSDGDPDNHLTEQGKADVVRSAEAVGKEKIDLIITSPILRARETASLVQRTLGLPDTAVMVDERLRETGLGVFSGKSAEEWHAFYGSVAERFAKPPEGGETFGDVRRRIGEFLFEVERRYTNKKILIVSHGNPLWLLNAVASRIPSRELDREALAEKGVIHKLPFTPFPHNDDYELDLHRPYIDEVSMGNGVEGHWERVPDVFDCWFESGSMPFASNHYPFEQRTFNPKRLFGLVPQGYPAHFIAEGLDQTRGWFYSLLVLGVALFGKSPYKAVVTNGLILSEDGQKMSKRLKNYPDPMEVADTLGADALRYYLLSSPAVRAEDLNFSLRGVEEVSKKLLMRLDNVRAFYELYEDGTPRSTGSPHILDRWILARLARLVEEITEGFEQYELDTAVRPIAEFADDLSTWYLRRSRSRFKTEGEGKTQALATLRTVLYHLALLMAPSTPFFAEELYQKVKEGEDPESVHLANWPEHAALPADLTLAADMQEVRTAASLGLEARERAGIKIRQPLSLLTAQRLPVSEELRAILADEVNVKEVCEDVKLVERVQLNTHITDSLREEGLLRDVVRMVQDMRKKGGLTITDRPTLTVATNEEGQAFFEKFRTTIGKDTGLSGIEYTDSTASAKEFPFPISISLQQ